LFIGVHRGGKEGAFAPPRPPPLADQNSMFCNFFKIKEVCFNFLGKMSADAHVFVINGINLITKKLSLIKKNRKILFSEEN